MSDNITDGANVNPCDAARAERTSEEETERKKKSQIPARDKDFLRAGLCLIVFLSLLVAFMFWFTGGEFLISHWAAFYVATALITGLAFWLVTPSPATLSIPWLGARLGGGAAIGAIFMLLVMFLLPPTNLRVVELKVPGVRNESLGKPKFSSEIYSVTKLGDDPQRGVRYLVEFREGHSFGEMYVAYPKTDGIWKCTIPVQRVGPLRDPNHEKFPTD